MSAGADGIGMPRLFAGPSGRLHFWSTRIWLERIQSLGRREPVATASHVRA